MALNPRAFSESESDDEGFDEDMEALRRACSLTGASPDHLKPSTADTDVSGEEDDDDDDIELVRSIHKRFSANDGEEPLSLKPICSLPPVFGSDNDDDCDDDLEILRAIQRRFSDYDNDVQNKSMEDSLHDPQVGATTIDSQKETSDNLFTGETNIGEGFPDYVDASITRYTLEPSNDNAWENQTSGFLEWHESGAQTVASPAGRDSGFPKSAKAFLDAIKKNRSCQKYLRSKLIQIEARIEENTKLRNNVKALKDFQVCCRRRTGRALSQKRDACLQLIQVPKLRVNAKAKEKSAHVMCYGPPENSHVPNYRMVLENFPVSLIRDKWTEEEDENLVKGIKQQFQDMLLQKTYKKEEMLRKNSEDLFSDGDGFSGDSNDLDSIIASIADVDITYENMRIFLPKVNWEQLASMYIKGRSGAECEARWLNWKDPLINKESWTKSEEKNLLRIAPQKGFSNWIDIAVSLGTNRTPFQCLAHYQRSLNPKILKRDWTEDEDDKLRAAVATFGESNWQLVASTLEGRTGTQCSNRWTKSIHPMRKRIGTWNPDEDKRLRVAVMLFGAKNWRNIAHYVPGRTHVQCRERWKNCLDPSLKLSEWSEEEDSRLKEAFAEYGHCWHKIAACVPPRTDNQCLRRWKTLFPQEVPLLQEARRIRKAVLISNFVDRESRRPALGPFDFPHLLKYVPETENMNSRGKQKRKSRRKPKDSAADTLSSFVAKLQSKRRRNKAQRNSERISRLTNSGEVENFNGHNGILGKKQEKKQTQHHRNSSKQNCVPSSVEELMLKETKNEKLRARVVNTARKEKASRRKKRKERDGPESTKEDTDRMKKQKTRRPSSCENKCSNVRNAEVENQGVDEVRKNRKSSKRLLKEIRSTDELREVQAKINADESFVGDETVSTTKRRRVKLRAMKNKGSSMQSHSSSFSDSSLPMVLVEDVQTVDTYDATQKKDALEPCLSEQTDGDVEPIIEDNNDERPPRCSTPDFTDGWNSKVFTVCRHNKPERISSRDRARSKWTQNTDAGDDMTLASFIEQSKKSHESSFSSLKGFKASTEKL